MPAILIPARVDDAELLDDAGQHTGDLAANLSDIRRLNRWFGGTSLVLRLLSEIRRMPESLRVLDVATGSADIPYAILRWGEQRGITCELMAVDVCPLVLAEAKKFVRHTSIQLCLADAGALPFDNASFDIVTCCLALHHFDPGQAQQVLREMWRVTRGAVLVTDLRRGYAGYAGAWLASRVVARNGLTRHDAPLSVLRAYTPFELADLASQAEIRGARIRTHRYFRQSLVAWK